MRRNESLAIPRPGDLVKPGFYKEVLVKAQEYQDIEPVDEFRRGCIAFEKYVRDKAQKLELGKAARVGEMRIGELLGPGSAGDRPSKNFEGMNKDERHWFRLLAAHPKIVLQCLENDVVSLHRILETIRTETAAPDPNAPAPTLDIRCGDFQDVLADLEPRSVPLILTDPPYAKDTVELYGKLAQFAAEKLSPGGSLLAYCGPSTLPDVLDLMRPHIRYWWTLALRHKHGSQQIPGKWVMSGWKPLVWFVQDERAGRDYLVDTLDGTEPRKGLHPWAQGTEEISYVIERLTTAGDLVVDPFAGSGTTGLAAHSLGRRFIGAEIRG